MIKFLTRADLNFPAGNLVFEFDTGTMAACPPVAWQEIEGKRLPVDAAFHLEASDSLVHFSLGAYNPAFTLFIDPTLSWSTFMGSSTHDFAYAVAVDSDGNVYVAGCSDDNWGTRPVNSPAGGTDAFAAGLVSDSGDRQWHTFMGSSSSDYGRGIAADGGSGVYVAGYSYLAWGNPVNAHAGDYDAFAAKLDGGGARLWHTFMGSSEEDGGEAIDLDGRGSVYVSGYSFATWGSPVNVYVGLDDAFTAKLLKGALNPGIPLLLLDAPGE